jgi:hypothetical protein
MAAGENLQTAFHAWDGCPACLSSLTNDGSAVALIGWGYLQ